MAHGRQRRLVCYTGWCAQLIKFKCMRFVLPGTFAVVVVVCFFWHSTADTDQWYLKRLDLSRPSAQWRCFRVARRASNDAGPSTVGWNKAVDVYRKNYSPPVATTARWRCMTNSYLMLGTELGIPIARFAMAICGTLFSEKSPSPRTLASHSPALFNPIREGSKTACRSGALWLCYGRLTDL